MLHDALGPAPEGAGGSVPQSAAASDLKAATSQQANGEITHGEPDEQKASPAESRWYRHADVVNLILDAVDFLPV